MKLIDISTPKFPNMFAMVDDGDFEFLSQWKWYGMPGKGRVRVYRSIRVERGAGGKKRNICTHREIMNPPPGLMVDHIDGDGLNNQRSNLRICTNAENSKNRIQSRTSKRRFKGVRNTRGSKFNARIKVDFKEIHLGHFDTEEEAALAYNAAAIKYFGAFAKLNVV